MRTLVTKSGAKVFSFDSVTQMQAYIDPTTLPRENYKASFVGMKFRDFDDIIERTQTAWTEGLMVLEAFIERLAKVEIPDLKSHKRKTQFDSTEGDDLDMDKLYQGEAFWRKTEREESSGPTEVTIVIDVTTKWSTASEDILWRGAAAIALTKILEDKGYKVEVIMVEGSNLFSGKDIPIVTSVLLKKASDPLDTSSLVNAVAGWFYRTACFALKFTYCKNFGEQAAYGLGHVYSCTEVDLDTITPDPCRIYAAGVFSFNGAANLMIAELQKLAQDSNKAAT